MAAALTVLLTNVTHGRKTIKYGIALSGNYTQAVINTNTGELLSFNSASNPKFLPYAYWGLKGPDSIRIPNGAAPDGLNAETWPAADNLHRLLRFMTGVDTELAAGAYTANQITDSANFFIEAVGNVTD
ncbi:MAG TPA: hypothetical protein VKZ53_27155 [Candidatus Angelobacter sp.]|nr:hypothetical protein [Candidatus Angelobacter sp.]